MLIFLTLLMFYSLFRLLFCFIKVFQKKEIKKFLWGDLVFGIVYLFLCVILQIPIFIIANFVKDDNRLNKYTYSTLIMANLLNISEFSLETFMLLEKTGVI